MEVVVGALEELLVGLGGGVNYLVNYPYQCAEQKASAAFAFLLAADLGSAFSVGSVPPADYRTRATQLLQDLPSFQCGNGGFGLWPNNCYASPYLTAYILHVIRTGRTSASRRTRRWWTVPSIISTAN